MSPPAGVRLRPATPEDAVAGAAMHRACWREAYGPYVDPALLDAAVGDAEGWATRWRHQIEVGAPRTLAETVGGKELVGFACAGPTRDDAPATLELYALYVRESWWGSGLGAALLEAVVPRGPEAPACSLWVLAANLRAQAFYRRHGFGFDGRTEHFGSLDADERRMLRAVGGGE